MGQKCFWTSCGAWFISFTSCFLKHSRPQLISVLFWYHHFPLLFPALLVILKHISLFMMPLQEFVSVWVRDPRIQKEDFWHSYIDYEICIHVSMQSVVYRDHSNFEVGYIWWDTLLYLQLRCVKIVLTQLNSVIRSNACISSEVGRRLLKLENYSFEFLIAPSLIVIF